MNSIQSFGHSMLHYITDGVAEAGKTLTEKVQTIVTQDLLSENYIQKTIIKNFSADRAIKQRIILQKNITRIGNKKEKHNKQQKRMMEKEKETIGLEK